VDNAYAWVTPEAVLFFRGSAYAARPWALNPGTGAVQPLDLPEGDQYNIASRHWVQARRPDWLENVRIEGIVGELATGQLVIPTLRGRTTAGVLFAMDPSAVRWSVSDTSVARISEGALEPLAAGTVQLVGSAGGWRTDTLSVRVADLVTARLEPVFDENWSSEIDTTVWNLVGEPLPTASSVGGPDSAGVFHSNGDKNYMSGAFTRRAFSLERGLTVEVWGRMPFDGDHWQAYFVRILDPAEALRHWKPGPTRSVDSMDTFVVALGFLGYGRVSMLHRHDGGVSLPWPEPTDDWRLYTLQVEPDGTTSVHYDGVLVARVPGFAPTGSLDSAMVGIAGNSWNSLVEHGRLRVYEGLRYQLQ
jgi:hypothetical protein